MRKHFFRILPAFLIALFVAGVAAIFFNEFTDSWFSYWLIPVFVLAWAICTWLFIRGTQRKIVNKVNQSRR